MSISSLLICDLCENSESESHPTKIYGIYWDVELVLVDKEDGENHICNHCLEGLAEQHRRLKEDGES